MLALIAYFLVLSLIGFLTLSLAYALFFALVYFFAKDENSSTGTVPKKFAVIIPAHNEELIIDGLCQNLKNIIYNRELYDIYIIADNCSDGTSRICRQNGLNVLERHNESQRGKGYAIKFAFENISLNHYDAFLLIDADTYVDTHILSELSRSLSKGEDAIQCYIDIPNDHESWFTKLISVARVMNGLFYHHPKYTLGLSSYLMGSGICFSTELIKKKGWTAFSIAEDWEYYAQLLLGGYRIAFAKNAVVHQYESKSLEQATSQRLRWSRGRWKVTKTLGLRLMLEGLKQRNLVLFDASLPLIFPNYSLQINLTVVALILSFLLPSSGWKIFCVGSSLVLLTGQFSLFIAGAFVAGSPCKTFRAAFYAPLFLIWKSIIDLLCFTGLYRGKNWVRTKRHQS